MNKFISQVITLNLIVYLKRPDGNKRLTDQAKAFAKTWENGREKRAMKHIGSNKQTAKMNATNLYESLRATNLLKEML